MKPGSFKNFSSLPPSFVAKRSGISYNKLWRLLTGRAKADPTAVNKVMKGLVRIEADCREARLEWLEKMAEARECKNGE